ncbi:MAG: hypothetical protein AAGC55_17695, partial [Myxococcota bacterium]
MKPNSQRFHRIRLWPRIPGVRCDCKASTARPYAGIVSAKPSALAALTLCLLALGVLALLPGCRSRAQRLPAGPGVSVVDGAVKIARDGRILSHIALPDYAARNPAWDGERISMAGARGETLAFQLIVRAGGEALSGVDIEFSSLRADGPDRAGAEARATVIATEQIAVFRQWYTEVTRPTASASTGPGHYPDALIPAAVPTHGLPADVPAGQVQGLWIDMAIPRTTRPGTYRGSVSARARSGELARFEIVVQVYDFELPAAPSLPFRVGYGGFGEYLNDAENIGYERECGRESAEFRAREAQLYQLSWAHRLAPTTHYSSPIPSHRGAGADLVIDWATFDQRFAGYLDGSALPGGVPLSAFSLPVNLESYGGWPTGTVGSAEQFDAAALEAAVAQTVAHWRERGWPLDRAFIYLADEPAPARYPVIDAACQAIRRA